jgi:hypothetical protein
MQENKRVTGVTLFIDLDSADKFTRKGQAVAVPARRGHVCKAA